MSGFTVLHLCIASLCAMLLVMHLALWGLSRRDPVHLWLAGSLLGFAAMSLGIAGCGEAAAGLGPRAPWLIVGSLGPPLLFTCLLVSVWRSSQVPIDGWRRGLLVIAALMGAIRFADATRTALAWPDPTWESIYDSTRTLTVLPAWGVAAAVVCVYLYETIRDLGRRHLVSRVIGASGIPAAILIAREILICVGVSRGHTWVALTSLPFVLSASAIVGVRYAQALGRRMDEAMGEYRLVRRLDAGGMGELFLAVRTGPGGFRREVALKRALNVADEKSVERLLAEARTAARLHHPNVVAVHDLGKLAGGWFIAMEYLSGVTLGQVIARAWAAARPVEVEVIVAIAEQVCRGLEYAHGEGVIHRDVSPDNVMISFQGAVKLIDFGIAEAGESADERGIVLGKTSYLSSDRLTGGTASPASDLHALGVVVYELVVGQRPFRAVDVPGIQRRILDGSYRPMRSRRMEAPPELEEIVGRLLAKDAASRFGGAGEAGAAFAALSAKLPRVDLGGWVRANCLDAVRANALAERLQSGSRDATTAALPTT